MFSTGIKFKNFITSKKPQESQIKKNLDLLLKLPNDVINSLDKSYKYSFDQKKIYLKYKNFINHRVIGMGGSLLGTQAIYNFLKHKIKKNFFFIDNLKPINKSYKKTKFLNLIVSKSGNNIETILNSNFYINKDDKNIFITEKKNNYLFNLANQLKAEIIHHNNYIGGRYSVLSEVGMLPAELMGLNSKKFKQLNNLIKNKIFLKSLISNVASTLHYIKNKKLNSVIINYDKNSESLFKWYQQLIAESLGKKSKGLLPIISSMPKDNHSVMQLYLDGPKNNFFSFFFVNEKPSTKVFGNKINSEFGYLKNKNFNEILYSQKKATENIFEKKKIPFRSFEVYKRSEKIMGELFIFFILETILLGKALNINPYDQPSVELIKTETKRILI